MNRAQHPVVVVGAGVSGLSIAVLLLERGVPVVVVERDAVVGGLARSYRHGDFTFDVGPHRFHTERADVDGFVRGALGTDSLEIPRSSRVRFMGRSFAWPLRPRELALRFPRGVAVRVVRDLLMLYRTPDPRTFRQQIENMYGPTLFRHFFEGYSTKFLGIPPEETDADWASTGIDRAIIDKRLRMDTLRQLVVNTLLAGRSPETRFVYPRGGCGVFTDRLADCVEALGGEVLVSTTVSSMRTRADRIEEITLGDRVLRPSHVVWTGTVHSAARLIGLPEPSLEYLSLLCFNVELSAGKPFDFQWCYHGAPDVVFSRVSAPAAFDPGATPDGKRSLCVEVACRSDDAAWRQPESLVDRVVSDMQREALVRNGAEVEACHVVRAPQAYPIYRLGYRQELEPLLNQLERTANLVMAGRLGRFWYNNMDHCIEAAFQVAERVGAERLARSVAPV